MELSNSDRDLLQRLEEDLWRRETRFDRTYMERVITPDFFEFGRSGRVYQRADMLGVQPEPLDAVLPLRNVKVRLLAPDVAQVTYDSCVKYDGVLSVWPP